MQTSQVSNPANVLPGPSSANRQPDANASAQPFNQVLSREMDGRRNAEGSKAADAAASSARQPVKNTKQADSRPAAESKGKEAAAPAEGTTDAEAQAPEDMLALVANLSQLGLPAAEVATPEVVEETPVAGDPALLLAGVQVDKTAGQLASQLNGLARNADEAGFGKKDAALAALADRHAARHGKPDIEPAATSATAAADTPELPVSTCTSEFSTTLQNTLPGVAANVAPVQNAAMQAAHAADRLTPRVGTPAWDQAIGQKVVWMVAGEQQSASLTLNPPDLGPLQVVLNVSNSQANATFIAAQPEVRQALESALPKLREMLEEAGIQLGQASVNSGEPNQQGAFGQETSQRLGLGGARKDDIDAPGTAAGAVHVQASTTGVGLVDTFA